MIVPTNQHETFQCALSLLTRFLENFPGGHPSLNTRSQECLTVEFLSDGLQKSLIPSHFLYPFHSGVIRIGCYTNNAQSFLPQA